MLLVVGIVGNAAFQMAIDPFRATPAQFVGVVVLRRAGHGRRAAAPPPRGACRAPCPRHGRSGSIGLVAGVLAELRPVVVRGRRGPRRRSWVGLAALAARWSVRAAWTPRHTLAAAAAALVTYAWHAFPETPVVPVPRAVDLIGNAVFALGAVLLITMAWRRTAAASTIDTSSDISS